jgi:2-dehydro-3-deoxygluconokinase
MTDSKPIDVLTFGETMGLIIAEPGPLEFAGSAQLRIGGAESNVAIVASRLGRTAHWVGRLGDDAFGRLVERTLRAEQVGVTVIRDPEGPTGLMVKERRSPSLQRVRYYRSTSAASRLAHDDIDDDLLSRASILHVTGITPALSPEAREAVDTLIDRARALGVTISLDINYRSALWTRSEAAQFLASAIPRTDILFGGVDEFAIVDPGIVTADAAIEAALARGVTEVIVKLGDRGAIGERDGQRGAIEATPVEVVDTVGAGDAFVGGYLSARLDGLTLDECLALGGLVGAAACTVAGDWEGAPRREELDELFGGQDVTR